MCMRRGVTMRLSNSLATAWLIGMLEIKDLDGERKALVYDNYSKLIAAADTIGKVRMSGIIYLFGALKLSSQTKDEGKYGSAYSNNFHP